MASGLKRCHTANGVVRAVADMSAHSRQRVNESRSFLNLQPLDSIGVVGAPDLGAVVEHTRIKTGSAAGAVLQKQVREFLYQPLLHLVNAQHIPVIKLLLMLFIEIRAAEVAELAVHIPFYINDIGASQDRSHALVGIIAHLGTGEVQNVLLTALGRLSSLDLDCPVRMLTVKLGIRGDHFRFKPDTEGQADLVDLVHQMFEAAGDLLGVDSPVT